ncbi:MAG: ferric reductase-like transmembrane domain-containing protein [Motilibacteraceae bacterium]
MTAVWYLSRGTGVTSLVLLTLVLVLGILTRSAKPLPGLPRFVTAGLHRNVSLLAVAFLALHIGTAVVDPYAMTGLVDVVVPFRAGYRPLWVGLGTLALDLLVALVVTSLLRHRLPHRLWRSVHWAAYGCWPLAVLHAIRSGTDAGAQWNVVLVTACAAAVGLAVGWRGTSSSFRNAQVVSR